MKRSLVFLITLCHYVVANTSFEKFYYASYAQNQFLMKNDGKRSHTPFIIKNVDFIPYLKDGTKGSLTSCLNTNEVVKCSLPKGKLMVGAVVTATFNDIRDNTSHRCEFSYTNFDSALIGSICKNEPKFKIAGETVIFNNKKYPGLGIWQVGDGQKEMRTSDETYIRHYVVADKNDIIPLNKLLLLPLRDYSNPKFRFNIIVDKFRGNRDLLLNSASFMPYVSSGQKSISSQNCIAKQSYLLCNSSKHEYFIGAEVTVIFTDKKFSNNSQTCTFNYFNLLGYGVGSICTDNPRYSLYPTLDDVVSLGYTAKS